jgi:hypothetical protein
MSRAERFTAPAILGSSPFGHRAGRPHKTSSQPPHVGNAPLIIIYGETTRNFARIAQINGPLEEIGGIAPAVAGTHFRRTRERQATPDRSRDRARGQ